MMKYLPSLILAGALLPLANAGAEEVDITFTNLSGTDGAALSPFFVAAQDGSFDPFNAGSAASAAIQQLSETGSGAGIAALLAADDPSGVGTEVKATVNGFGPGIYLPGGEGSVTLNLNPGQNSYLSYFSMVVPSNDRFVGNDSPTQIQLFNSLGNLITGTYTYNGASIWDAGAVQSQINGAAFLMNNAGTQNTPIVGGTISANDNFSVYDKAITADGYGFSNLPGDNTPLFSITVSAVPVPGVLWLIAGAAPFMNRFRRQSYRFNGYRFAA